MGSLPSTERPYCFLHSNAIEIIFQCNIFNIERFHTDCFFKQRYFYILTFLSIRTATAVPQDESTNLRRRLASQIDSRTHDQKSQASTADLRSNEEGQRSPSDWGSLTSSQRSTTRVRFQSNRYGPMGGITPTKDFPQTMHYSSWLVRAGYR